MNGPRFDSPPNEAAVRDWMNLLNRGIYRPLVRSSDAHEIDADEPGYSRTWVLADRDRDRGVDADTVDGNGRFDAVRAEPIALRPR